MTAKLEREGVGSFVASLREMIGDIERKREAMSVARDRSEQGT